MKFWGSDIIIACCLGWGSDSNIDGGRAQTALLLGLGFRKYYSWGWGSDSIIACGWVQTALLLVARVQKAGGGAQIALKLGVWLRLHLSWGKGWKVFTFMKK